jgi:hypothetical protein
MQYDSNLMFDDGTTALSSAGTYVDSPNAIKVPNSGVFLNQGLGEPTVIDCQVVLLLAGASLTGMTVQLFAAPDSSGSPGTYDTVPLAQANFQSAGANVLTAGSRLQLMLPPLPVNRPWIKLRYQGVGNTTLTGGKIFATIVPAEQVAVP